MGTRRVGYEEVPTVIDDVKDVTLIVGSIRRLGGKEVTGSGVMPTGNKRVSDSTGEFTSD
jgi:hypothetical protein